MRPKQCRRARHMRCCHRRSGERCVCVLRWTRISRKVGVTVVSSGGTTGWCRAENRLTGRSKIDAGRSEMAPSEITERSVVQGQRKGVVLIGRSDRNNVRNIETCRKLWNEIIVWFQSSIIDISRRSHEKDLTRIQLIYRIQECRREQAVSKTRVDDANVSALRLTSGFPKTTHFRRISTRANRVDRVTTQHRIQELQRHQSHGPVNT